jgi:hypothetical protein
LIGRESPGALCSWGACWCFVGRFFSSIGVDVRTDVLRALVAEVWRNETALKALSCVSCCVSCAQFARVSWCILRASWDCGEHTD